MGKTGKTWDTSGTPWRATVPKHHERMGFKIHLCPMCGREIVDWIIRAEHGVSVYYHTPEPSCVWVQAPQPTASWAGRSAKPCAR